MAKTRPGADRISRQALRAAHALAVWQLHAHLAQCITCKRAESDLYRRCNAWWRFAKAEHRTHRALREYEQPETRNMDPLWTEEQCDPPPF